MGWEIWEHVWKMLCTPNIRRSSCLWLWGKWMRLRCSTKLSVCFFVVLFYLVHVVTITYGAIWFSGLIATHLQAWLCFVYIFGGWLMATEFVRIRCIRSMILFSFFCMHWANLERRSNFRIYSIIHLMIYEIQMS